MVEPLRIDAGGQALLAARDKSLLELGIDRARERVASGYRAALARIAAFDAHLADTERFATEAIFPKRRYIVDL